MVCEAEHPHKDPWQRLNAAVHCACSTGLGNAAKESKCCEARDWGEMICSMDVDEGADGACGADCSAPEIQSCVSECRELCSVDFAKVTQECLNTCMAPNARCRNAAACEPAAWPTHNYVCDDEK